MSFNSILVRLKVDNAVLPSQERDIGFNSILVRLKVAELTPEGYSVPCGFQFHTGSIKSLEYYASRRWKIGFNSILVRLKGDGIYLCPDAEDTFQFHTGSIKSFFGIVLTESFTLFQFHTGSIKRAGAGVL